MNAENSSRDPSRDSTGEIRTPAGSGRTVFNRATRSFLVIVLAQAVFLLAWAGYHEGVRAHAPTLLLKGRPVDPQDLLRGDFMILGYDISEVTLPAGGPAAAPGTEVWVLLERRDRYHVVVRADPERLVPGPGQVLVHGKIVPGGRGGRDAVRVNYGIERYFVPEGRGSPRFKLMEIEVSVSPEHRLYVKRVLLDGSPFP